jgi:hypothetical protein
MHLNSSDNRGEWKGSSPAGKGGRRGMGAWPNESSSGNGPLYCYRERWKQGGGKWAGQQRRAGNGEYQNERDGAGSGRGDRDQELIRIGREEGEGAEGHTGRESNKIGGAARRPA